ncbi:hypothetical protein LCGC14_1684370 [marine sediment metagenome]|uniref:Uncharacterized protein n=1 Tax=marine sediment metagenome TaxID=412755 RepID=A0A0F9HMU0_9ZZZZ
MQCNIKKICCLFLMFMIISASFQFLINPLIYNHPKFDNQEKIHNSGQTLYTKEWLNNNNFSTYDDWNYT